ncbi:LytTR family transcriptional regulator DNA-binding domain-containing protein [Evansella sp. LMS18]|uniref:LytTR family DNA-binding domain-containing protein n=1 Tax=Evansella sp. LMS18 TaxID=2924033 RepID=UPI0020D0EADD|nr:LytTR family DNA-binding domain-containing protein [Evansella sp. LMS18]UTR11569.1 LytTR family transcriptional regulator DNA-binding domain-containing protein [Evansella sp. LMS18]
MKSTVVSQFSAFIQDWVPEEASIAIAGGNQYISYIPGRHDIKISQGQPIPSGSITERVYMQKSKVESLVDKSVFGVPYYGVGYPIQDEDTGFTGALTVILPPEYTITAPKTLSFIAGRKDDIWVPLSVEQIIYIESHQKKTLIYTNDGCYSSKHPLKALEPRLSGSFMRIHRSYIVNISYIKEISRDVASNLEVTLKNEDNTKLVISQNYVQRVRNILGF